MNSQRRTLAWVLVVALAAVLVVAVATSTIIGAVNSQRIRDTQVTNTRTLDTADRTLDLIRDCTEPGGECFDRGQKRTADVVADLNKAAVYAAACADKRGVQGEDEIYACVVRLFAADAERR